MEEIFSYNVPLSRFKINYVALQDVAPNAPKKGGWGGWDPLTLTSSTICISTST